MKRVKSAFLNRFLLAASALLAASIMIACAAEPPVADTGGANPAPAATMTAGGTGEGTAAIPQPETPAPAENKSEIGAAETPAVQSPGPQNVILISWDGFDRSVLNELLDAGKLPNLAALISEGSRRDITLKGHPTVTKPAHAVMLTSLDIKTTGVLSNRVYQPIPEGYTVFERLQTAFGKENIRTVMVSSKIAHVGGRGPDEIGVAAGAKGNAPPGADDTYKSGKGEPFFLTKKHLDVFDSAQREASETGPLCLKYLSEFKSPRFFAFLHFSDPDHAGHKYGIDSPEYRAAAIADDEWLGKIVEWLKKEDIYGKTLIYAMADHGFNPHSTGHGNAPNSWVASNDKHLTRDGSIADVPATIMKRFGLKLNELKPALIGAPLDEPAPKAEAAGDSGAAPPDGAAGPEVGSKEWLDARFKEMDKNGDGVINRGELGRPRIFNRMDADGDGRITKEEADEFFKAHPPRGQGGNRPGGGRRNPAPDGNPAPNPKQEKKGEGKSIPF
jgi:hypothetical protein